MKRFLVLFLSLILAVFSFTVGCGKGENTSGGNLDGFEDDGSKLTIRYFNGGYGDEWLKDSVNNFFTELRGHAIDGQDYELIADASVTSQQEKYLKSTKYVPDILITQGGYDGYVNMDLIADISDVFEEEVTKLDGTKIKIKDYMLPAAYQSVTRQIRYGEGAAKSWAMPWSAETFSFAYNETLLLDTTHTQSAFAVGSDIVVGQKWTRAPETVDELLAYFADINESNKTKSEAEKVVPFGWGYPYAFAVHGFIINCWWAQIQGTATSKIDGEGSFYDFFNFKDMSGFDQTGIKLAFDTFRSLIIDGDGNYINSDVYNNLTGLEFPYYKENSGNGRYAVWVAGDYWDNEVIQKKDADFVTKFMFVPNAKDANGNQTTEKYTYIRTDEAMYVPAKAKNKALAKKFLAFMCNEAELVNYSKKCGGLRPFKYNPSELAPEHEWTPFQESFYNIYNNADEVIMEYPLNITDSTQVSPIYLYQRGSIHYYGSSFAALFSDANRTKSVAELMETIKTSLQVEFDTWKIIYGPYFQSLQG